MTSVNYEDIYSRFYTKVEAYDLVSEEMSEIMAEEFLCNWLHSSVYEPYVRKLFKQVTMNDDEGIIEYELNYVIDEGTDKEFVTNLLSYGIIYHWIYPKVYSITNIVQMFSASDSKWYSQASHLSQLQAIKEDAEYKMRALIRDRGYLNNQYLDGKSALSSLRG